jgi:hypothetical protein
MSLIVRHLSEKHVLDLQNAVDRALVEWAPGLTEPRDILEALERVVVFLRQKGGPSTQSRQVAAAAFVLGHQVARLARWTWHSVSEDGTLNPSVVSPDGRRALPVVDVTTQRVLGEVKAPLWDLVAACVEGTPHPLVLELDPGPA